MKKYKLKNGITLIFEKNSSKSVAVEVMFKVGSNDENIRISGVSHFLEHMLFEGTKKRKDSRAIANEIEKYGAEFNAYTSGDRTAFFIKIINKKFDSQIIYKNEGCIDVVPIDLELYKDNKKRNFLVIVKHWIHILQKNLR